MDDLAAFLRTRRARVDPATFEIPTDRRRRVQGLRREEVAHLSGVSVDYYVRLEQGRATQPSEQVLDALARVLGLDETEVEHLHRLARLRRSPAEAPAGTVRPQLQRVLNLVVDAPALIMDHRLDVRAGNDLARLLYGRPLPGLNTRGICSSRRPIVDSTRTGTPAPSMWSGTCGWLQANTPTTPVSPP